jgi:predicted phosphoribosyltransferase
MTERFRDRSDAGRRLGEALRHLAGTPGLIVLGLPRGGVPVAHEVALSLAAPLEIFLVRKLGVPGHEELALGAIASGGARVLNAEVLTASGLSTEDVETVAARELLTLERQEKLYRARRPPRALQGASVVLVDDGLATGATMRAAVQALGRGGVARIAVGVPVAPRESCVALAGEVDEMICLNTPARFRAVGLWYRDFSPVGDHEVRALLNDEELSSVPPPVPPTP